MTFAQLHGGSETHNAVLFGGSWPAEVRLPKESAGGFVIRHSWLTAPAGDVNGDGRDDVLRFDGERSTVLLGQPRGRPAIESGFVVTHRGWGPGTGAGDVDGDGRDDLIFGRWGRSAAVVFGRTTPATVRIQNPGRNGFRVVSRQAKWLQAWPAGDVDGDRRADLLVLAGGQLYLVSGAQRSGTLELERAALSRIVSRGSVTRAAPAGDVNGDRIDDLVVGTSTQACVVFGMRPPWPHRRFCGEARTLLILGPSKATSGSRNVSAAGDLDGDGRGDVVVAMPSFALGGREWPPGAVYVVFGRREARAVSLERDRNVVRIAFAASGSADKIGDSVAAPGDVTGDGKPDIVIGGSYQGAAWIVSGFRPAS